MSLPNSLENLKDIGLYSFSDDGKGNIILNFRIDAPGNYSLKINKKDMRSMEHMSRLGEALSKEEQDHICYGEPPF